MYKRILALLFLTYTTFSEPVSSEQIDDGDKGSAPHGNLINNVKTASKVYDAVNATANTVDAAKKVKSFDPSKFDAKGMSKDTFKKAKDWASAYTHAKGSLNQITRGILDKISKIINQASKRVELWRTTYPSIKRYANNVKLLADDTKNLAQSFRMSDLIDIDRKWSRHLEYNLAEFRSEYYYINNYLKKFRPKEESEFYHNSIVPIVNSSEFEYDETAKAAYALMPKPNAYRSVPRTTLEYCASSMFTLSALENQCKKPDTRDQTITAEMATFNNIDLELSNSSQSYADTRQLATYIEQERAKVRMQSLQATQIQSGAELRYANLLKRDEESRTESKDVYTSSLRVLCAGAGNYEILSATKR
jgi:hypothetical protein